MLETVTPWDLVAEGYAEVTTGLFEAYADHALDHLGVGPGTRIADIGCGPGTLALLAAERGADVSALDFSPNMIALLRSAAADRGLNDRVTAVEGDGQALPFADASFDAAASMFALMFFPDRARGHAEIVRVLRPGGVACVASWAPVDRSPMMAALFGALQQVKPDLPEPEYDVASLENPDVLKAEMERAGLVGVEVHEVSDSRVSDTARAFWTAMEKGAAPIVMLKRDWPADDWAARTEAAIDWLDTHVGPFPARLGATALLGVGRKPA